MTALATRSSTPTESHRRSGAAAGLAGGLVFATLALSCCRTSSTPATQLSANPTRSCPAQLPAPPVLPDELPEHGLAQFWLQQIKKPDRVLMDAHAIKRHNERILALRDGTWPSGRWRLLDRAVDRAEIKRQLESRMAYLQQKIVEGKALMADGTRPVGLVSRLRRSQTRAEEVDELRVAWRGAALRCYPLREGLYEEPDLHAFDLTQCSQVRFGEPVRVLMRLPRLWYVWTTYATGWADPAAFGPAVDARGAERFLSPDASVVVVRDRVAVWGSTSDYELLGVARLGAILPLLGAAGPQKATNVLVPTRSGLAGGWIRDRPAVTLGYAPFARATLFARAFSLLNEPYGWGGMGNKRDCSRFLMDLFGSFGLLLPRNSSLQAKAGQRQVDVEQLSSADKTKAIAAAAEKSVVLLYFPGHIMLFLGFDQDKPYAIHQFSGYLVPCRGGGETMLRANRTAVTSLDLGIGGSRRSFLQRTTRLVLFGDEEASE